MRRIKINRKDKINVSQHYLLMEYYLMQFTWCQDCDSNRIKIILKELNRRLNEPKRKSRRANRNN
mgnify:CR=1 FL=1